MSSNGSSHPLESLTLLVPRGAEYKAVKRGLRRAGSAADIIAVPAGAAIEDFVKRLESRRRLGKNLLLMGLGGGLCRDWEVGRSLLLSKAWNAANGLYLRCDDELTQQVSAKLSGLDVGVGVTSNRIVTIAAEKRQLGDRYQAKVVDMESFYLMQALPHRRIAVLRVVSDACDRDLPDISLAINSDGTLNAVRLIIGFAQKPLPAVQFIKSSLRGLRQLEEIAFSLFEKSRTRP